MPYECNLQHALCWEPFTRKIAGFCYDVFILALPLPLPLSFSFFFLVLLMLITVRFDETDFISLRMNIRDDRLA